MSDPFLDISSFFRIELGQKKRIQIVSTYTTMIMAMVTFCIGAMAIADLQNVSQTHVVGRLP